MTFIQFILGIKGMMELKFRVGNCAEHKHIHEDHPLAPRILHL